MADGQDDRDNKRQECDDQSIPVAIQHRILRHKFRRKDCRKLKMSEECHLNFIK
jgi:hypothetical protein